MSLINEYHQALDKKGYQADEAQLRAVTRLDRCVTEWAEYKEIRTSKLKRLLLRPDLPRGVYMHGGVGRGKSFLMDLFYQHVAVKRKTRIHFHEFMRAVHHELETLRGTADPLDEVAKRIARKYRLICFDEFHVSDIADAMILHRLLDRLYQNGVVFVMTSNYHPDGLYPEGLHRDRILPAIALLKQKIDVLNVDAGIDYRRRSLEQVQVYHTPLSAATDAILDQSFATLAETPDDKPELMIEQRQLRAVRRAGGVVWFNFKELCGGPRSQNDYLEIASQFHTVILSEVPVMSAARASEARRFTWLIDVFYDHGIKLIMSAESAPEALYTAGQLANEFHRTVSRIVEMQSKEYLDAPRRAIMKSF